MENRVNAHDFSCDDPDEYPCVDHDAFYWPDKVEHQYCNPPNWDEIALYYSNNTKSRSASQSCITYSYFANDDYHSTVNVTRFPGRGIEDNDGSTINEGCYEQEIEGYTLEVCFCGGPLCNRAQNGAIISFAMMLFIVTRLLFILT